MIRASIDIGSNSVLLLVAELSPNGKSLSKEILNLSHVTSLGKDLDKTKKFCDDSMTATYEALADYKKQLEKINIDPCDAVVTATEAARVATNALTFFAKIKNELGFSVTLISSKGEAYYTALGVVSGVEHCSPELIMMDIGGASTELIRVQVDPFKILSTVSLPVGSVRATDWRVEKIFDEKMQSILAQNFSSYLTPLLICVAGSMTSLATMFTRESVYDDKKIDGLVINFASFKKFNIDLQKENIENLRRLFPHLGKRAPMILAGAMVAEMLGEKLAIENMKISTRGLRYGTLIQGEIDEQFIVG